MVIVRNIAALIALGCTGFAVGDWASHPNAVGMLGILAMIAVFGFLLAYLFKPRPTYQAPPPPPPPPSAPGRRATRSRPSLSSPPAGWDSGDDADSLWR